MPFLPASGGGGGGGYSTPVTPSFIVLLPSQGTTIPTTVKEWTFTITNGSAAVNGNNVPGGVSDSGYGPLAIPISITADGDATVYVRWSI